MTAGAEGAEDGGLAPRSMVRLLLDAVFGTFFLGKLLATAGMWINNVVAAIVAFQVTGSAFMVGLVSVAQFIPQTVLAPLSGAMADRGDRKRQLLVGRLIASGGSLGLATSIWIAGGVDGLPGVAPLLAGALVVGVGLTIGQPAMHSLVPSLVRPTELAPAMTLNSAPFTLGRAVGPAVGALLATTWGPAPAFAVAAAGNLAFVALVAPLRIGARPVRRPAADASVRAGLAYARRDRRILLILLGVVAISFGADPVMTLTPALSHGLGGGPPAVGFMASAFGIGAGLAFPLIPTIQRRFGISGAAFGGLGLMAVGNLCAALSWSVPAAVVSFGVVGIGMSVAMPSFSTLLQALLNDEFRGRVMALWMVSLQGTRPFAAMISGGTADATSVGLALVAVSVLVAVVAWQCRPSRIGKDTKEGER